MNKEQLLLGLLAEECAEIAQRASKASRFGLDEVQKGQDKNNRERLHEELNDLMGVVAMLNEQYDFGYNVSLYAVLAKREKIEKYARYSAELGRVTL